MEGHCSTGQSPQWVVMPMEEEEEERIVRYMTINIYWSSCEVSVILVIF